jgi:hypothetical protein
MAKFFLKKWSSNSRFFWPVLVFKMFFSIPMKQSSLLNRKKIYSQVSFKRKIPYLLLGHKTRYDFTQIPGQCLKLFPSQIINGANKLQCLYGAMTLSITTSSIMTLSIKGILEALSMNDIQHNDPQHNSTSAIMLSVIGLSVEIYLLLC